MSTANVKPTVSRAPGIRLGRIAGGLVMAFGVALAVGGLRLVMLYGSPYYLLSGIGYVTCGVLLWRRRPAGGWLALSLLVATIAWAFWEVGLDFWALFPRFLMPAGIALLALLVSLGFPATRSGRAAAGAAGAVAIPIAGAFALAFIPKSDVYAPFPRAFVAAPDSNEPSDWQSYGRTTAGTRYAPFTQINRENVAQLKPAWTIRSGAMGPGVDQSTPLLIGDLLYTCVRNNRISAVDADTGQVRWRYDPGAPSVTWAHCRGVGYYELPVAEQSHGNGSLCARRIFTSTVDSRLIALDAATGTPCADFGKDGVVDLKEGMGRVEPGYYYQSSAPVVARGRIIIGGGVPDNMTTHAPSGVIRAFDARTGALAWAWDLGNPDVTREPPPAGYTRGTPNMWSTPAYDDALGLVYVPLGNETPDYFGATRNPASDRYSSSITALDIETGRPRWSVQTVHHDLWDFDVPSQPALIDLPDGRGETVPALLQTTKRGQLFLLNRATGDAISRIVERRVPQNGAVPEERLAATQPYSIDMPAIGTEPLDERKAWGMTMLDQLWCRISFRQHRYQGEFTPPGVTPSLEFPGPLGGLNWGSVSIDPLNHIAFMNDIRMASSRTLVARSDYRAWAARFPEQGLDAHGTGLQAQAGTPYGAYVQLWVSPLGVPCNQPPFGTLSAVDLVSRKILWQVPAGTTEHTGPLGISTHLPMPVGMPTYAGTSVTAGGLLFFAGTQDFYLRAYDTMTGQELWKSRLPVGSGATPMTYVSPKTGRQYVVISAGGAARSPRTGDYLIAFALPTAQESGLQ